MTEKVLFVSGHRTDDPNRAKPRFPEARVDQVRGQIADELNDLEVGPKWTVITGGARGADLLTAKEALRRGARLKLCLATQQSQFIPRSVSTSHPKPAENWVQLFDEVRSQADLEVLPVDRQPADPTSSEIFVRANDWMLDQIVGTDAHALLVWDGSDGSTGGTGQMVDRLYQLTPHQAGRIKVIDPTPRAYEARQDSPGPKRILALDGGGIRGVISLEILTAIEAQLRERFGNDALVLSDYFDYIAGTSTGAIIATGLALGKPVSEIRDRYHRLGHAAFRSSPLAWTRLARYSASGVQKQLEAFLGGDLSLGDPRLRTLLLIVMHHTGTDSPWLLSNCTRAKYNRPERLLPPDADRNLDLPLLPLVRASTAAPTYFPPQEIAIKKGSAPFVFQDGGVTAFNNPALIVAVMATLPDYNLNWRKGTDDLLVVSVGTGFSAATGRRRKIPLVEAVTGLAKLVSVFMNGASFSQDLLCRFVGDCRYGPRLDNEVGDLIGHVLEPDPVPVTDTSAELRPTGAASGGVPEVGQYFSYIRYDADLSNAGLESAGISRHSWKSVRKLAAVSEIDNLVTIGQHAAGSVKVTEHFRGFLRRGEA